MRHPTTRVRRSALLNTAIVLALFLVLAQGACIDWTGPSAHCETTQGMGDPTPVCK